MAHDFSPGTVVKCISSSGYAKEGNTYVVKFWNQKDKWVRIDFPESKDYAVMQGHFEPLKTQPKIPWSKLYAYLKHKTEEWKKANERKPDQPFIDDEDKRQRLELLRAANNPHLTKLISSIDKVNYELYIQPVKTSDPEVSGAALVAVKNSNNNNYILHTPFIRSGKTSCKDSVMVTGGLSNNAVKEELRAANDREIKAVTEIQVRTAIANGIFTLADLRAFKPAKKVKENNNG